MTPDQTPFKDYFAKHAQVSQGQGHKRVILDNQLYKISHDSGQEEWFRSGQRRLVKYPDGNTFWYRGDTLRRAYYKTSNQRMDQRPDGTRRYKNQDGTITYYNCDNQLHRTDGPAVIRNENSKEFWIQGRQVDAREFGAIADEAASEDKRRKGETLSAAIDQGTRQPLKAMKRIKLAPKAAPAAR